MANDLNDFYSDLRFSEDEIYLSDEELSLVAVDFWGNDVSGGYSHRDRCFLQAALFVAVQKSEDAGFVFSIFKSFVSTAPSGAVVKLLKKLVTAGAKYAYAKYIDDDPKYSAVGRAGVQYSAFATQWRLRVGLGDDGELADFRRK